MKAKFIIQRKDLYNGDYDNIDIELLEGKYRGKIELSTHLSIIYRIAKKLRKGAHNYEN